MTPESRNSPLLDNGSLKHVSVTTNRHAIMHELLGMVISIWFAPSYKRGTCVKEGSNTSTVTLRVVGGDENGSLKSETVKYGTRTRVRLRWQGPAAYIEDRPVLSSERAPHKNDRNCQTVINIWSWAPDGVGLDTKTYWLTDRQSQCDFNSRVQSFSRKRIQKAV
jgi:hypothetical protein